jgi:hypothetical protein
VEKMRKKIIFAAIFVALIAILYPQDQYVSKPRFENQKIDNLKLEGNLEFTNLEVTSHLDMRGSAEGDGLKALDIRVDGNFKANNVEAGNVTVGGDFIGDNITIKNNMMVEGRFEGKNVTAGTFNVKEACVVYNLTVNNSVYLGDTIDGENITVKGESVIFKDANLRSSSFQNLNVKADKIVLNGTNIKSITYNGTMSKAAPILFLEKNSVVEGDVVFEGEAGEVRVDATSAVKGQLKNGKIINL